MDRLAARYRRFLGTLEFALGGAPNDITEIAEPVASSRRFARLRRNVE